MMGVRIDRETHTMTSGDATVCLEHAQAIDPHRGYRWQAAFWEKAKELGYRLDNRAECRCYAEEHRPECGYAKKEEPRVTWPHLDTDYPADGLLEPRL